MDVLMYGCTKPNSHDLNDAYGSSSPHHIHSAQVDMEIRNKYLIESSCMRPWPD